MKDFPTIYINPNNESSILAFGFGPILETYHSDNKIDKLSELDTFIKNNSNHYLFGFLEYDLKNEIENVSSENHDGVQFPSIYFWNPEFVVEIKNNEFEFVQGIQNEIASNYVIEFLKQIKKQTIKPFNFHFQPRISKEKYINKVVSLKNEIQLGNVYEVNFCQEYFSQNVQINNPIEAYTKLNKITKAPFSVYFDNENFSVFCGSPERFIKKSGAKLISEPIKGTSKRGETIEEDQTYIQELKSNPKERSENIMIVDLVRNDLSKIAKKNSVQVDELCGIYSFETVHQMISTISCEIENTVSFTDILKATFPMGSMTGAPKLSAMNLIESHESFKRGIYSGSIGYIKPNGDFDFNVVIRTMIHNKKNNYLSCAVGSAITILSDPEKEFEECAVKVNRIINGMNE